MGDSQPFTLGHVVWAKLKGHPWWPAIVSEVLEFDPEEDNEQRYKVHFLGDQTYSFLSQSKLVDFQTKYNSYWHKKSKSFRSALEVGDQLVAGVLNTRRFIATLAPPPEPEKPETPVKIKQPTPKPTPQPKSPINTGSSSPTKPVLVTKSPISQSRQISRSNTPPAKITKSPQKRPRTATSTPEISAQKKQKIEACSQWVLDLEEKVNSLIQHPQIAKRPKFINPMKLEKMLWAIIYQNISDQGMIRVSKNDLEKGFEYLMKAKPSRKILKSTLLFKTVNHFKEEFIDSRDPRLWDLAKNANKLVNTWQSEITQGTIEEMVTTSVLYTKRDIVSALKEREIDIDKLQSRAEKLEAKFRNKDPSLGPKYNQLLEKQVELLKGKVN